MAVVQSAGSVLNFSSSGSSVSIPKPTGLQVGDLMLACVMQVDNEGWQTKSGWTLIRTQSDAGYNSSVTFQYRVATSGDVAASDFAFTTTSTGGEIYTGTILRIDGFDSGTPLNGNGYVNNVGTAKSSFSFTHTLTPSSKESLAISCFWVTDDATGTATVSAYSLTPASMGWTEHVDTSADLGSVDPVFAVASANYESASEITNFSCTTSVDKKNAGNVLILIRSIINETGTNALLSVSPTQFAQEGVAGTTGTNTLLTVSPTMFDQSGKGQTGTPWTNPDKPYTNWDNLTK